MEAFADSLRAEVRHLGVNVGVAYFAFIDTDMVRGADAHPVFGGMRAKLPGPLSKTYPLSDVGDAVVDGIVRRRRWVTVPSWIRAAIMLRGPLQVLSELGARRESAEVDAKFDADIANRGAEAASAPVGPGGRAGGARREHSHT